MCYGQNMVQNRKHNLGRIRLIRKLLREFCKVPTSRRLWCRGLLLVYGFQMYRKIILVKMIGASLGLRCFSDSSFSVICIPLSRQVAKKTDAIFWDYNAHEALLLPMAYVDPCCFQDLLYVPTGHFGHQNHHLGGHHSSVFIQNMFVSPSLQFFWYFCWFSLPALFA